MSTFVVMHRFVLIIFVGIVFISSVAPTNQQDHLQGKSTTKLNIWQKVQRQASDTVVQLFVDTAEFNWTEPYKTPKQSQSFGSGFFIDAESHLITNYHVIDEAVGIKVQVPSLGKEQFDAKIVGVSPDRDIALLKLKKNARKIIKERLGHIPYLKLGDSDKIVRTQEIMALGYPLGQEKLKSTQGIVSGRELVWDESYIQITAALNAGNSGGPSLDSNGTVIGINTARIPSAQGVGYIIPINDVKNVISSLHVIKFLRKPTLGCEFNYGTKYLTKFLNNPTQDGFYVSRVYKDTLLDRVGIRPGDVIYKINDLKFDAYGETNVGWSEDKISIIALLNRFELGQKINISAYRAGKKIEINFNFDLTEPLPIRTFFHEYEKIDYEIIGGMVIMEFALNHIPKFEDVNPYLIKYTKRINQYLPRLIITHIFSTSETMDARILKESDCIKEVNGIQVRTLNEFRQAALKSEKFLTIKSNEKKFMVLSLEKILKKENLLAETYFYKKTKLVNDLINARK